MGDTPRDWPRMMKRKTAADYCDLSIAAFEREVIDGRLPIGVNLGGQKHWSRTQIDAALERITGGAAPSWREKSGLYGNAAA